MKTNEKFVLLIAASVFAAFALAQGTDSWKSQLARSVKPESRKGFSWATGSSPGKRNPAISVRSSDPTHYYFDFEKNIWRPLTPDEARSLREERAKKDGMVRDALILLRKGDSARAKEAVRPILQSDDLYELASRMFCEALLHERRYGEALAVLAPFVEHSKDPELLTMAVHAGAMKGQSYPGQRAFCNDYVLEFAGFSGVSESLPKGDSLASVRLSSTLARATFYSRHGLRQDEKRYFVRALELEPTNAYAGYMLGKIYEREQLWQKAAENYQVAATHGEGALKSWAKVAADWMKVVAKGGG